MPDGPNIHGGCLCGAVRYSLRVPAVQTTVCHCSDCRRASGAPFMAWTFFPVGAISWTCGTPKQLNFAERVRSFCGDCGTPLHFFDPDIPEWFEVSTCSLDEPELQVPADVCWTNDRLRWSDQLSHLPAFDENAPLPDVS